MDRGRTYEIMIMMARVGGFPYAFSEYLLRIYRAANWMPTETRYTFGTRKLAVNVDTIYVNILHYILGHLARTRNGTAEIWSRHLFWRKVNARVCVHSICIARKDDRVVVRHSLRDIPWTGPESEVDGQKLTRCYHCRIHNENLGYPTWIHDHALAIPEACWDYHTRSNHLNGGICCYVLYHSLGCSGFASLEVRKVGVFSDAGPGQNKLCESNIHRSDLPDSYT